MRTDTRLILASTLTILTLAMLGWLVTSVGDLHDRLARVSPPLAIGAVGIVLVIGGASALVLARFFWKLGGSSARSVSRSVPRDVIQAAEVQTAQAEQVIGQVRDTGQKARLDAELAALRVDQKQRRFHVVVFGTGSAGKTSLINALLGRAVGKTEAVMGTTQKGEEHTHLVEGVDGVLVLTDTPGLSEIGEGGAFREAEARDLAARADLLLFVVDHDLVRSEYEPLIALARQGKRSIVVFNKRDRFPEADRQAILVKLRERLAGVVPREDIVAVAAAPRPTMLRVRGTDGSTATVLEPEPPDLADLQTRIALILEREGDSLRAGNLLLRAHLLTKSAREQRGRECRVKAEAVIDKFQWVTAGTVFVNPLPALELMATGAVQFQMVSEIAGAYGVELSTAHARAIGTQLIQTILKLGLVEAATSLVAGLFKSTFVGYAAGGALQATTMAYLTHISGHAVADYFEQGQSWGDGGIQAELIRVFDLNSRAEFLQEFARQAIDRVVKKVGGAKVS